MRCKSITGGRGNLSAGEVAAAIATTGIFFNVKQLGSVPFHNLRGALTQSRRGMPSIKTKDIQLLETPAAAADSAVPPMSVKLVDLFMSNCKNWANTGHMASMRLTLMTRSEQTKEELAETIRTTIGGDFDMKEHMQFVECSQALDGFLQSRLAERCLLSLQDHLDKKSTHAIAEITALPYPLESIFKSDASSSVDEGKVWKWVKHLRMAEVSEQEIASHGLELIHRTSEFYDPQKGVPLQDAIKKAATAFRERQPFPLPTVTDGDRRNELLARLSEGVEEKLPLSQEEQYSRSLRPLADFGDSLDALEMYNRLTSDPLSPSSDQ